MMVNKVNMELVSTMKEYLNLPSHLIKNVNDYRYVFRRNDQPGIIGIFQDENDRFYQLFLDFCL